MDTLKHYGIPRKSGRYPWGSGENPYQSSASFLGRVEQLHAEGLSEVEIARALDISTTTLRARKTIALEERKAADAAFALRLKEKGYSNVAIGERLGRSEGYVRKLLDPALKDKASKVDTTAKMLEDAVAEGKYIDIGGGVENHLGISRQNLLAAVAKLEEGKGYKRHYLQVRQLGTGKNTSVMVLTGPDVEWSEVNKNKADIQMPKQLSLDKGRSFFNPQPIQHVERKRIAVRYGEDGGGDRDGVIELRRGVDDISLGNSRYAQVRVGVDEKYYLKGMAVYSDDMPDGVDIIFNTPKPKGTPDAKVFKEIKMSAENPNVPDPDNPFGATVYPKMYTNSKGDILRSKLNVVYEEGDWGKWSKSLSSQMLSKQTPTLAKRQLTLEKKLREEELNDILQLTNPAVKNKLLHTYADSADSAAVQLKAASLPRQRTHVILPLDGIKDDEIYAPNYKDGEKVVLIRYPHGGIFEIPQLTVNNKNKHGNRIMKNAKDAVGISAKTAHKMSGADFDGDTVLVIPNNTGAIKVSNSLKGLKDFDPQTAYPGYSGMKKMVNTNTEMGKISNLITDMTIKGATEDELSAAVRHSMVVIDAEKHGLNYEQSYIDNNIAHLKKKYQGATNAGASTIISRASSQKRVPKRADGYRIDPKTGKKIFSETGETYKNRDGKIVKSTQKSTAMAETDDAFTLSSGTVMEDIYAQYANDMKALANKARKELINTKPIPYSPSARKTYIKEVQSLDSKLNIALQNRPLERKAQIIANTNVDAKRRANPDMDKDDLKRLKNQALVEARHRVGASKSDRQIEITDREWEAIQAGAISHNKLNDILDNADLDRVRELATPRENVSGMSNAQVSRAKSMLERGYTQADVAEVLGVSVSTIIEELS